MGNHKLRYFRISLYLFICIVPFFVMIEWLYGEPVFFLHPQKVAITTFNTALLILISSFAIILSRLKPQFHDKIIKFIAFSMAIFTSFIVIDAMFNLDLKIDNLFIEDTITSNSSSKMSLVTAICFGIFSTALYSYSSHRRRFINLTQHLLLFVPFFALLNIISAILKSPSTESIFFLNTMSLEVSISLIILTYLLFRSLQNIRLKKTIFKNTFGSSIFKKSIPFVLIIPLFLGYFMLDFINKETLHTENVVIFYTMILILTAFFSLYIASLNADKSDRLRKKAENNLILKNTELIQYKEALDQIAIIAITDEKGVFKYVNDKFCEISKFERDEIIGQNNVVIRSDFHPFEFFKEIEATIFDEKPWFGEIKNKAKDGSLYWTNTAIIPLKKRGKFIKEYMAIKLDISEKKEAEELLASKYVKTLEQKNKELEQFTYITSHDLQEPIRTIASFYDILNKEYGNVFDDNAKQIFKFIKDATGRMSNLIKNLLDYSRIGHSEELTEVDFNILLREVQADLNSLISKTNTTITAGTLPTIQVYPTVMRLLIQNLVSNAIKFTKKDVAPVISIDAQMKNDMWEFSIKDNGIGIAKEHQKKIFAIFQRLHLKDDFEGTGIGLAHCQKIIGLHQGEIWVASKPNEGSTFYFTLPIELS